MTLIFKGDAGERLLRVRLLRFSVRALSVFDSYYFMLESVPKLLSASPSDSVSSDLSSVSAIGVAAPYGLLAAAYCAGLILYWV